MLTRSQCKLVSEYAGKRKRSTSVVFDRLAKGKEIRTYKRQRPETTYSRLQPRDSYNSKQKRNCRYKQLQNKWFTEATKRILPVHQLRERRLHGHNVVVLDADTFGTTHALRRDPDMADALKIFVPNSSLAAADMRNEALTRGFPFVHCKSFMEFITTFRRPLVSCFYDGCATFLGSATGHRPCDDLETLLASPCIVTPFILGVTFSCRTAATLIENQPRYIDGWLRRKAKENGYVIRYAVEHRDRLRYGSMVFMLYELTK